MSEGLDHRHRDKNGHIAKKHGNTRIKTLRKIYGLSFAKGHPDDGKPFARTGRAVALEADQGS